MHILAYAASNSSQSINAKLIGYAKRLISDGLISDSTVEQLDIHDFEMPIYRADRQRDDGIPDLAHQFYAKIGAADALIISFAEHNGHFSAAYKNLYDWMSRIDRKVYQDKPTVMLATSPGGRGGTNVLASAMKSAASFGADLRASLSVPNFHDNFDVDTGRLTNAELDQALQAALLTLKS